MNNINKPTKPIKQIKQIKPTKPTKPTKPIKQIKPTKSVKSKIEKSQKLRIGYLAWGSLLWDSPELKVPEWTRTKMKLPLEYSRASDGGFGRLTLVIDAKNGTENRVWIGETTHKNINSAIKAVRKREGSASLRAIAYIDLKKNTQRVTNTPEHLVERIKTYAKEHEYDVIIWTDLASNWVEIKYCAFDNENVINYFRFLPVSIQVKILAYIYQASRVGHIKTKFSTYLLKYISNELANIN